MKLNFKPPQLEGRSDHFLSARIERGSTFAQFEKSGSVVRMAHPRLIAAAHNRMSIIETTTPLALQRFPALAASS
jgi:hypothetical protein